MDKLLPTSSNSLLATTWVSSCLWPWLIAWQWLCGWLQSCIEGFYVVWGLMGCFSCLILMGSISNLTGSDEHIFSHLREIFSEHSLWYKYKFVFFSQHGKFSASENSKSLGRLRSCLILMNKKPTKTSSSFTAFKSLKVLWIRQKKKVKKEDKNVFCICHVTWPWLST